MAEVRKPTEVADCNFCRSTGRLKDRILASSDEAYAIETATGTGNYFLIPEAHYEQLEDLPGSWWREIKAILFQLPDLGDYNLSINIGEQAGQRMRHLHFWIIPRHGDKPSSGKGLAALITEVDSVAKR